MTARTKTLALLAAGTTVVGGAAGTAVASADHGAKGTKGGDGQAAHRQHHGKELRKLARALDVRPGELRKALREASGEAKDAGLEKFAAVVGKTPDQVRDALKAAKESLTGGAEEPGTSTTPTTPGQPTTPSEPTTPEPPAATTPDALAGEAATRTPGGDAPTGTGRAPAPDDGGKPADGTDAKVNALVAALAKELGVEPAKILEAGEQARDAGKAAFVETLAEELDVDADEVTEALERVGTGDGKTSGAAPKPGAAVPVV